MKRVPSELPPFVDSFILFIEGVSKLGQNFGYFPMEFNFFQYPYVILEYYWSELNFLICSLNINPQTLLFWIPHFSNFLHPTVTAFLFHQLYNRVLQILIKLLIYHSQRNSSSKLLLKVIFFFQKFEQHLKVFIAFLCLYFLHNSLFCIDVESLR